MRFSMFLLLSSLPFVIRCGGEHCGVTGICDPTTTSTSWTTSTSSTPFQPIADAAWTLTTTQPDPTTCSLAPQQAGLGSLDASNLTQRVLDGMNGATVTCAVVGAKSFEVHGVADGGAGWGSRLEITIPAITPAASKESSALGTLTFLAAGTAGVSYTGACSFYFVPKTPETVAQGRFWAAFDCAGLSGAESTCPATGFVLFENCDFQ